jgi:serine/threonine protein kinase
LDVAFSLRLAISLSTAIGHLHQRGIVHKDIKPANALVNSVTAQCWLSGFGFASRLPRERLSSDPPSLSPGHSPTWPPSKPGV